MDVKSTFLYGTVEEEVYVCQPPGFEDHDHPDKVYKVVNALYGLHQAPRACQDKYVAVILRKFGLLDTKSTSTPIDIEKPLLKDPDGEDVDMHTYRLIFWQCKKQTVVATSSIEAEYVVVASCYAQVLRIQNQLLDYGFGLTLQVVLSVMDSLKMMFYVPNILSAGSLTTQQMVLNSPCLTHIKNWLVQIKWSLKLFANIRRVGKGFSKVETPLFAGMLVEQQVAEKEMLKCMVKRLIAEGDVTAAHGEVPTANEEPSIPSPTRSTLPPQPSHDIPYTSLVQPTPPQSPQVHDVIRLRALVDKKKVVVTEATIREALRLDDAEGVECLPNEEIFAELARMGFEKPSTKLTFYKAFFSIHMN
nr:ribonuclease H-like domain, reverse transcriptase, RNA-dependent DNA polymerase [Tanacetum cinerariifolium]